MKKDIAFLKMDITQIRSAIQSKKLLGRPLDEKEISEWFEKITQVIESLAESVEALEKASAGKDTLRR